MWFLSIHTLVLHPMLSDWLKPNSQSLSDRSCPSDSGLSTANRLQQGRTFTAGKPTLTTLTFRCDPTVHQLATAGVVLGFNCTVSTSLAPPVWYLIVNLPVSLIFTFDFPQPPDISMVTKAEVAQGLGGAVHVHLHICQWLSIYVPID